MSSSLDSWDHVGVFEPKNGPVDPPRTWRHAPHSLLHSATTVKGDNLAMMVKGQLSMHFFRLSPGSGRADSGPTIQAGWFRPSGLGIALYTEKFNGLYEPLLMGLY